MKQKKKIRKRKYTAPTRSRGVVSKDGHRCARGTKKLMQGNRPWLGVGTELFL